MLVKRVLVLLMLIFSINLYADVPILIIEKSKTQYEFVQNNSHIDIEIDESLLNNKDILLNWVVHSAQVVSHYYGQFPVNNVFIRLEITSGKKVTFGQAFGGKNPFIRVVVGKDITLKSLQKDWILVHEMGHLAMAHVDRRHLWLLEGLATYVESIARAQLGDLKDDYVWSGFVKRMPQGLPKQGDKGLDYTPTWGRRYWGGAIFCLLADIKIRELTNNKFSLQDALIGVINSGYSMHASTTPETIFKAGDKAVGVDVLLPLYEKMKDKPYPVDLMTLWKSLGIDVKNGKVLYTDEAPLADIRKQLLKIH